MSEQQIPNDWQWATLGEICEINPRRPKDIARSDDEPTTFVPMAAVDEISGTILSAETRSYSEVKKGYTFFCEGDVLFSKITPCMENGKHSIAFGLIDGIGFGTTEFHVIRPTPRVTAEWIHYFLRQPSILAKAAENFTGSVGQQRVPPVFLERLEIPIPTALAEQQRIAARIEAHMMEINAARTAAEAELAASKELPSTYLREAFESEEAQAWDREYLSDYTNFLAAGSIATEGDTQVRAITSACLTEVGFNTKGIKNARMWSKDAVACVVSAGEVLIARSNTSELVGRVSMYEGEPRGIVASDLTIRIETKDGLMPEFLTAYLSFLYLTGYWKDRAGGASGTMKKITRTQLAAETIPVPPIPVQQLYVSRIREHMSLSYQAKMSLEGQLVEINDLQRAVLEQAFNGEL